MWWRAIVRLDCWINRLSGGLPNETLCARAARSHGTLETILDRIFGASHCELSLKDPRHKP
jgi:hypothetical protein